MNDLEGLISRLISSRVEFVVVGGFAAVAHGSALMTRDVDICCRFSVDNLMRLQQSLADLHPIHRMTPKKKAFILTPESCKQLKNLYLSTDLGQLDCLSTISGVGDFEAVQSVSIEVNLPYGPCRILSLDALIQAKEALNRERDREAILQLKAIRDKLAPH